MSRHPNRRRHDPEYPREHFHLVGRLEPRHHHGQHDAAARPPTMRTTRMTRMTRTTTRTTRTTTREAGRAGSRPRSRRADAFILQPRFLRARYYLRFPDLRDSDASTLRTSDWEIPNCLAIRVGVIPALKVARTALIWPDVNATSGSSGCRRSGDSSVVVVD